MDVTNENAEDTPLLTKGDLAVAAFTSLNHIRTAFVKFDTLLKAMSVEETDDSEV